MRRLVPGFAWIVVRCRYLVVAAWIAGGVAATLYLPSLEDAGTAPLNGLVPSDARALRAQVRSAEVFRVPVLTDVVVVQRDPAGLSEDAQRRAVERAARASEAGGSGPGELAFALPIVNAPGLVGARESFTTALTYLFFRPGTTIWDREDVAREYEQGIEPGDHLVGATGPALARIEESSAIDDAIPIVEAATVALVALVLALTFRSIGAPLVALAAAVAAYFVTVRGVAWIGETAGIQVPREVEPVAIVILLGIVTDYAIFFLSGYRARLAGGDDPLVAAERATVRYVPIVFTAGLIVAAGTAALVVGELDFFRAFGPGLALTALIGMLAAITLVPALLAIFGRATFWPGNAARADRDAEEASEPRRTLRGRIALAATARPVAGLVILLTGAALVAAATGLRDTSLGFTLITGLPGDAEAKRAAAAAEEGFAAGVLAPTELLLERPGIGQDRTRLVRLQEALERQPGVAGVLGPRDEPDGLAEGAAVAEGGDAARYLIFFEDDPLGADAIGSVRDLRSELETILPAAGLEDATAAFAGQTALAEETISTNVGDLWRIALAALGVNLLLLVVFLRSLVAPLFLLAASVLPLAATLGQTTYVFQDLLGYGELTYYVPFAAAVLLLSLGSDYNVFVVGQVWEEAGRRPLREAVATAAPRASRSITVAGIALACSFALLAIVPLRPFRELAFALAVGVLLDAFVVRSLLVPALISFVGEKSWWPGRRLRKRDGRPLAVGGHGVSRRGPAEQ